MKKIKVVCLLLLTCTMLFLTGCWNYREIDTLSIVAGLAIDKGDQGAKYRVTFELLDLSAGSKNPAKPKLAESEGDTVFDAVRNVVKSSEKKLFFSDCKIVIISSDLAKDGIQPVLDWFARDAEPRITLHLLVSQENTASDILKKEVSPDDISSYRIANMLENDAAFLGKAPQTKLYETYNILDGKGISLILPCIKTPVLKSGPTIDLSGTAIFKKDKLVGFLSEEESKFLLFVNGKIKGGMLLTNMESNQSNISLEITKSQTKVTPVISNGQVTMKIDITTKVAMAEDNTGGKLPKNPIEDIQKSAEKTLVENVKATIKKVQDEYDSDVFGFGSSVYRSDPTFWKKVEPEWDKQFAKLKCDVTAKVEIENTATAKIKEKGGD